MRIVVNGQELHLPANPGGLLISLHLEPGGEDFGPCVIDVYGGELRFTGNSDNPNAVTVTSRHSGYGIVARSAPMSRIHSVDIRGGKIASSGITRDAFGDAMDAADAKLRQFAERADEPLEVKLPRGGMF